MEQGDANWAHGYVVGMASGEDRLARRMKGISTLGKRSTLLQSDDLVNSCLVFM